MSEEIKYIGVRSSCIEPSLVLTEVFETDGTIETTIQRNVIRLHDEAVREALITLGWTPPPCREKRENGGSWKVREAGARATEQCMADHGMKYGDPHPTDPRYKLACVQLSEMESGMARVETMYKMRDDSLKEKAK